MTKALTYRIGADYSDLRREMEKSTSLTAAQRKEFFALERQQRDHRRTITELGVGMAAFGTATLLGLGLATKAAIQWESAFAGVRKTVDGSDAEIASLEGELRQLARTLPTTHEEIAGVAEAAGQLGIKRKDIAAFTKTMIDLGNTTNLTAEEAATDLAKFSNIMGTSASDVDRLGSALVALGNDGASTEKDIISMGLRIAGAGKQIGLTEAQVLGIASALSSVGIEAEAGGSSISSTMIKIASAVEAGGAELESFAEVAGMTGAEFAGTFRADAAGAIVAFVAGLGKMQRAGKDVFGVLDELGLSEIRVRDALLRAGSASDMFTKSLRVGNDAWIENTALAEEANKRYETSASKLAVAGNQIKDALIDVGAALAPIAAGGAQAASDLAKGFQELPGPLKDVVTWAGAAAGALALFGGGAAIAAPKIMDFRDKMRTLEASGGAFSKGLGKAALFMTGPWGAAIGIGVSLLGLLIGASGAAAREQEELAAAGKDVAGALKEQNGVITESVRQIAAKKAAEEGMLDLARRLGIDLPDVTSAILEQGGAYDNLKAKLEAGIEANKRYVGATKSGSVVQGLNEQGQAYEELLNKLNGMVGGKDAELQKQKDTATATKEATGEIKDQADETAKLAKQAEDAGKALDELVKALDAINGVTLTAREAQRSYIEQLGETAEVLKKNGAGMDINTKKGRENQEALDAQAAAANKLAEAAAREAESTGGAAAGAAALKASLEATRPKLLEQAKAFFGSKKAGDAAAIAAEAYVNSVLGIPSAASTQILTPGSKEALAELIAVRDKVNSVPPGKTINIAAPTEPVIKKLQDLGYKVETLPDGTVNVTANTKIAQDQLDTYIRNNQNRIIGVRVVAGTAAAGRGGRTFEFAEGGVYDPNRGRPVHFYASGGVEDHQSQVAGGYPGAMRVWAEDPRAKETYLSWRPELRGRSLDIARYTLDAWGWDIVPKSRMVGSFGGQASAPAVAGGGGGVHVDNVNVRAYSDRFSLAQVMNDIAMAGAR